MPRITDMQMRRGRPERFILTVDDDQEFVFSPETVLRHVIAPGKEFSNDEFRLILEEDAVRRAKDQAMRYLEYRPHSRLELVRKMRDKGYSYPAINQSLDQLEEVGLVNDEEFARLFIQNELRLRPVSRRLLKQKLGKRGIQQEMADTLLLEYLSPELESDLAAAMAEKYQKTHPGLSNAQLMEKLVRYLQGKGFGWEQIREVIRRPDGEGDSD